MNVIQQQKHGVVIYGPVNLMHITAFMELAAKMLRARKSSLVLDALISQALPSVVVDGTAMKPLMVVCRRKDSDAWREELGIEVGLEGTPRKDGGDDGNA